MAILKIVYLTALVLGCGFAAIRGGAPERWGAAIVVIGMILSNVAGIRSGRLFFGTDMMLLTVDTAMALALITLALTSDRYWPLWAAMLQLDAVFTHIVMLTGTTPPFSYGLALWLWAIPLPMLVGIAAIRHRRRIAKGRLALSFGRPAGDDIDP